MLLVNYFFFQNSDLCNILVHTLQKEQKREAHCLQRYNQFGTLLKSEE